ncbi:PREDICTED: DIS3-like exonuclease 2 isoform X2 [Ipomoea nil]|uniref:DIS3-like exonuclease 2 isoform X2 n=1 Tax=Ipomoea nil TaxID=35883 RepID=UPI000900919A|nr:PREDICTED: DIS3-like exonuclease 2 isoform X2 [Ipomoea nil]
MGVLVESIHSQAQTVEAVAVDNKDKKKKRRSRRGKQSSPLRSGVENISNNGELREHQFPRASDVAFSSLPIVHLNEQTVKGYQGLVGQEMISSSATGRVFSGSCPQPSLCNDANGELMLSTPDNAFAQRKCFTRHWLTEDVDAALERGDVFKALFRVNAHNKLEAYCKIDGVQTDVLISGAAAQNRAVEGDIVAIEVDPPSLWIKMKGFSSGTVEDSASADGVILESETSETFIENAKGKMKVDSDYGYITSQNQDPSLENRGCCKNDNYKDPIEVGCVNGKGEFLTAAEKLSITVNSFPSKRPTGRVVAIHEASPRRDKIVGFLSIKKWMRNREINKKDSKNKHSSSVLNYEYLLLTPTDPRFSKMMVPVKSLPDIIKKRLLAGDATVGTDLVGARIVDWGEESCIPEAQIIYAFGRGGKIETHIAAILFENAVDVSEFSPETLSCLPNISWEVPREEFERRHDIRNLCVFTIDPDTATDLDDALSVESLPDGTFRVGVHIADASYFVLPDTPLDTIAQIRSTSVYLLQSKLPMLPPLLSENLGSLNPGVDRLAFSIFWDINPAGEVLDRWIGRTIIRSCCKLSYEHAQDIINDKFDVPTADVAKKSSWPQLYGHFDWTDVIKSVKILYENSKTLRKNRFSDGALSLNSPKIAFLFDEDGVPYDSLFYQQKDSHLLIEEFMLLANRTVAEVITRAYPSSALLRNHPEPNIRKLREFQAFCKKHGLKLDSSSSGQFNHSLELIRQELKNDSVLFDILMSYATRPMQLATYFCSGDVNDTEWGHYALAIPLYTHFTSPLRRYPDIVVHRTLAAAIEAEEMYIKCKASFQNGDNLANSRCFTGTAVDGDAIESSEARELLSAAALRHKVPCTETLVDVVAHCNERKLASRHVKDSTEKLYTWALLKRNELFFSEARVLGLGPRFMSIYINRFAIERRIYYDEIDGLSVEWLDTSSTLVLSMCTSKHLNRRGSPGKCRTLEDVAFIVSPCDLNLDDEEDISKLAITDDDDDDPGSGGITNVSNLEPAVFPLTVQPLSTIPVVLHAVGGEDGPIDIGARLYISSYFR